MAIKKYLPKERVSNVGGTPTITPAGIDKIRSAERSVENFIRNTGQELEKIRRKRESEHEQKAEFERRVDEQLKLNKQNLQFSLFQDGLRQDAAREKYLLNHNKAEAERTQREQEAEAKRHREEEEAFTRLTERNNVHLDVLGDIGTAQAEANQYALNHVSGLEGATNQELAQAFEESILQKEQDYIADVTKQVESAFFGDDLESRKSKSQILHNAKVSFSTYRNKAIASYLANQNTDALLKQEVYSDRLFGELQNQVSADPNTIGSSLSQLRDIYAHLPEGRRAEAISKGETNLFRVGVNSFALNNPDGLEAYNELAIELGVYNADIAQDAESKAERTRGRQRVKLRNDVNDVINSAYVKAVNSGNAPIGYESAEVIANTFNKTFGNIFNVDSEEVRNASQQVNLGIAVSNTKSFIHGNSVEDGERKIEDINAMLALESNYEGVNVGNILSLTVDSKFKLLEVARQTLNNKKDMIEDNALAYAMKAAVGDTDKSVLQNFEISENSSNPLTKYQARIELQERYGVPSDNIKLTTKEEGIRIANIINSWQGDNASGADMIGFMKEFNTLPQLVQLELLDSGKEGLTISGRNVFTIANSNLDKWESLDPSILQLVLQNGVGPLRELSIPSGQNINSRGPDSPVDKASQQVGVMFSNQFEYGTPLGIENDPSFRKDHRVLGQKLFYSILYNMNRSRNKDPSNDEIRDAKLKAIETLNEVYNPIETRHGRKLLFPYNDNRPISLRVEGVEGEINKTSITQTEYKDLENKIFSHTKTPGRGILYENVGLKSILSEMNYEIELGGFESDKRLYSTLSQNGFLAPLGNTGLFRVVLPDGEFGDDFMEMRSMGGELKPILLNRFGKLVTNVSYR